MHEMKLLVTYASVHGSTAEIARAVALTLRRAEIDVDVVPARQVQDVRGYDSVVLGSAVYGGQWCREAVSFLDVFAPDLACRRLWLFQSGPLGRSAQHITKSLPLDVSLLAECLDVRGCATFGGRLDPGAHGPMARLLCRAGLAQDYRDFGEIRAWADEVGRAAAAGVLRHRRPAFLRPPAKSVTRA